MFLPASGYCYFDEEVDWYDGGSGGYYWSSKQSHENLAYYFFIGNGDDISVNSDDKSVNYDSCRLVRE